MSHIAKRPSGTVAPLPVPNAASVMSPDEIFQRIESVRGSLGMEPSFLERLFSPGSRKLAAALAEAQESAIRARQDVIEGLRRCIATYIEAHQGDLKVRGAAFVTATFITQFNALQVGIEDSYQRLFEVYSTQYERIDEIRNLSDEEKTRLKDAARQRAWRTMERNEERFDIIVDEIREQVTRTIKEIGAA